ncbi:MAG: exopolysaccharide biosynthesis protein [Tepidisphaeraceae bacterium]
MTDTSILGAEGPPPSRHERESLVDELRDVMKHVDGRESIRVGEIVEILRHRGPALVMLLLCIPFVIPIPSFGLSTPLGLAIMFYGGGVMLRMKPWVPGFISRRTLKRETLEKIVNIACKGGKKVEKLLKPRLKFMLWPMIDVPIGFSILFCGFFLGLPLPIPFTNAIPAVALILLLLGVIEQDGVAVLLGEILTLVILAGTVYVCYLCWVHGIDVALQKVGWGHTPAATTQPTTWPATAPT